KILPLDVAEFAQSFTEFVAERLCIRAHQHERADSREPRLLRARRARPKQRRHRRAAEQRDELAALHSITSSARADKLGGTSIPICLAVFRFITNSNLLDCMTGKSAGFSPLRIRAT